jgi:hypothetical protein
MSCAKLAIDVTELEKSFALSPVPEMKPETVVQPKKKRFRECADLRNFWDEDCERESVSA